jgi:Transposase DDE domain
VLRHKENFSKFVSGNAFSRDRKLTLVNAIGAVLEMVSSGNEKGSDITSQNFFDGILEEPPTRQSICDARKKLPYEVFRHLLEQAARENRLMVERWHGHRVFIIDGTKVNVPRTEELLALFDVPNTSAGPAHYPQAWMVTLLAAFCNQPLAVELGSYKASERDLMKMLLPHLKPGDLALIDRGLGGAQVYWEYESHDLFYIHRVTTSGDCVPKYVREFLDKKRASQVVAIEVTDEGGNKHAILIRLVRGPKDSDGNRIVFATNLLDEDVYSVESIRALYRERWAIETTYGRIKNLLKLEQFHAKSFNGIMQEIYANLLIISLTAAIEYEASKRKKLDRAKVVPNFKAAMEVVHRHLHAIVGTKKLSKPEARLRAEHIIEQAGRVLWKKQPGRSCPRVSMQPIKKWNLCKNRKLKEFAEMAG